MTNAQRHRHVAVHVLGAAPDLAASVDEVARPGARCDIIMQ
jgi:hypothetical protein